MKAKLIIKDFRLSKKALPRHVSLNNVGLSTLLAIYRNDIDFRSIEVYHEILDLIADSSPYRLIDVRGLCFSSLNTIYSVDITPEGTRFLYDAFWKRVSFIIKFERHNLAEFLTSPYRFERLCAKVALVKCFSRRGCQPAYGTPKDY